MEIASPALLRIQVQKTVFLLSVHLTDTDKLPCSTCSEREANAIFRSGLDFDVHVGFSPQILLHLRVYKFSFSLSLS